MNLYFRPAQPDDTQACMVLCGLTRENAISEQGLQALGITVPSWSADSASGELPG